MTDAIRYRAQALAANLTKVVMVLFIDGSYALPAVAGLLLYPHDWPSTVSYWPKSDMKLANSDVRFRG